MDKDITENVSSDRKHYFNTFLSFLQWNLKMQHNIHRFVHTETSHVMYVLKISKCRDLAFEAVNV